MNWLDRLAEIEELEDVAFDPGSVADFEAFCRATGNDLRTTRKQLSIPGTVN